MSSLLSSNQSLYAAGAAARSPSISVFVGTANLGNTAPNQASLSEWIPYDGTASMILPAGMHRSSSDAPLGLIVLGFQEATFAGGSESENNDPLGTKKLHLMLQRHLPSYSHIVKHVRGEMRLEIFCHSETCSARVLHVGAQNTGLAGRPNKGGIQAQLLVKNNLRLSFTTCHLEAHEGTAKYKIRCSTMADILHGTRPAGEMHDATITSHYAFVLGDLNFRTDLPKETVKDDDDHKKQVRGIVDDMDWMTLREHDELKRALENKDCLVGFNDSLPINFPPTFKVERGPGYKYVDKRRPSYTDRILYKASHDLDGRLRPLLYEGVEHFTTSDHKPVRGVYEIQLNDPIVLRPKFEPQNSWPQRKSMANIIHQRFSMAAPMASHRQDASKAFDKDQLILHVSRIKCQINQNADTFWKRIARTKMLQQLHQHSQGATADSNGILQIDASVERQVAACLDNALDTEPNDNLQENASVEQQVKVIVQQQVDASPEQRNGLGLDSSHKTSSVTGSMVGALSTRISSASLAVTTTLPNTAPSPYVMFVASPEACVQRQAQRFWLCRWLSCIFRLGRRRQSIVVTTSHPAGNDNNTKARVAKTMGGWPRTSVRRHTREADWGNEAVKIQVHTHSMDGQSVPLTGSMLKISVMDGEGTLGNTQGHHPLIGTFSFNLASLLLQCMHQANKAIEGDDDDEQMTSLPNLTADDSKWRAASSRMSLSSRTYSSLSFKSKVRASRRGSVLGFLGLNGINSDQEMLEADIDEPLLRNGKEVGRIQCRIEAYWVNNESTVLSQDVEE
ncbi:hypothetical protein MPSEU_000912200 [Mayamaea pseudoterrestris]|nr:hypothetical protein MPSEU_000912200 [Mayamaea pseudoterrestris]